MRFLFGGRRRKPRNCLDADFSSEGPVPFIPAHTLTLRLRSKIFPEQPVPAFQAAVRGHVLAELEGLDPSAVLGVKKLIKAGLNDQHNLDAVNLRESYAQAQRFETGIPSERFGKIARKELKHKL